MGTPARRRAIKKAIGGDAENYDNVRYEGYGPGGVAVIVEALTDNRNRTAGEVRAAFTKSGGNLAETGAVSSTSVKDLIGKIVGEEDVQKPLSDQKISEMLKSFNITVARRTVAKYREQLGIAVARLRKVL